MTATPLREENRDTYLYFGNPIYTYSLRQGIDDGFLAPYRVHRIISEWDAAGWRPSKDELDRYGRPIPDEEYGTKDFERTVALRARTEAIAKHLTDFLKKHDRFAKTVVFCVDQEHADEMRRALNNLNSDLVGSLGSTGAPPVPLGAPPGGSGTNALQQTKTLSPSNAAPNPVGGAPTGAGEAPALPGPFPDYVCRVTSDDGDIGRGHLGSFQDVEGRTPIILTTSQMLTTGVDVPALEFIVFLRPVKSRILWVQMLGCGTRTRRLQGTLFSSKAPTQYLHECPT
jgi:type I restriction enzyme R subunit